MNDIITPDAVSWKLYVTIGAAAIGAVLGIINTLYNLNQKRVRLKIRPAYSFFVPGGGRFFSIEVINLSTCPVTIALVGFTATGGHCQITEQQQIVNPVSLPKRLESREAITIHCDLAALQGIKIKKAYAKTSCGETATGTSPALKDLRRRVLEK